MVLDIECYCCGESGRCDCEECERCGKYTAQGHLERWLDQGRVCLRCWSELGSPEPDDGDCDDPYADFGRHIDS